MNKRDIICLGFLIYLLIPQEMPAWSENTHKLITQSAILNSVLSKHELLKKLNFERSIYFEMFKKDNETKNLIDWVKYGSVDEDTAWSELPSRSNNHFHNPLKSWSEAGLDDWSIIHSTGSSAIFWTQLDHLQEGFPHGINTWDVIRTYFYAGLTRDDSVERQKYFAETFKGLGHQVHLLEDMSVPDHVRNDGHILNTLFPWHLFDFSIFRCIEGWAKENPDDIQSFVDPSKTTILFPNINLNRSIPLPLQPFSYLYDTDSYNSGDIPSAGLELGLSEYTNANFVSEDTVFSSEDPDIPERHQFPYPKKASTDLQKYIDEGKVPESYMAEDGKSDLVKYIAKITHGDLCNHFLAVGYFGDSLVKNAKFHRALFVDNLCHKDYASMLIPRAVGYSAALINYFFRGEIEVTLPIDGIYSLCTDQVKGFEKISLMVKNITPNNEEMKNGQVSLVLSYRLGNSTPFVPNPPLPGVERIYKIYQYINPIDPNDQNKPIDIPINTPIRLDFNLTSPLPTDAVDVNLTIVFKGNLGAELIDAVAIGFKDISEPTPIDLFNNTDLVCFSGSYVNYTDPALLQQVDTNHNGRIDCDQSEINIIPTKITPLYLSFNGKVASATNYYYKFPETNSIEISPNHTHRFYFLSDSYPAMTSYSVKVKAENSPDSTIFWTGMCPVFFNSDPEYAYSYFNKLIWNTNEFTHDFAPIGTLRNNNYYNILIFKNVAVPENSTCTYSGSGLTQTVGRPTEDHNSNRAYSPRNAEKEKSKM